MGREIRRVPLGWEHPRDERGNYVPMFDEDFESVANEWVVNFRLWENGTHKDLIKYPEYKETYPYYWQYDSPPTEEEYRPKFETEPICYQVYEDVSEGTPVSPVFKTQSDMKNWLIKQGHSEKAATDFIELGFCFSMVINGGQMKSNIDTFDIIEKMGIA